MSFGKWRPSCLGVDELMTLCNFKNNTLFWRQSSTVKAKYGVQLANLGFTNHNERIFQYIQVFAKQKIRDDMTYYKRERMYWKDKI